MLRQSLTLAFDVPESWTTLRSGNRFVYQGQAREELIVSGTVVQAQGEAALREQLIQELIGCAHRAMLEVANDPGLRINGPLQTVSLPAPLCAWVLHAEAVDATVLFSQVVVQHSDGVTLFTFEAPLTQESRERFSHLLSSFHEPIITDTGV